MKPEVWMIQIPSNPISMYYRGRVENSWSKYNLNFFNAVTPEDLKNKKKLNFGKKRGLVEFSPTEKATWYSHFELWQMALKRPILVIEHDALLTKEISEKFWKKSMVCLGYAKGKNHPLGDNHKAKLAGLAYYITKNVAREMIKSVVESNIIEFNSDAVIHDFCRKNGVLECTHVLQFENKLIGNTIEHYKK